MGQVQVDVVFVVTSEKISKKEYLIYDGIGMFGSIGGSLGLFVGFSFSKNCSTTEDLWSCSFRMHVLSSQSMNSQCYIFFPKYQKTLEYISKIAKALSGGRLLNNAVVGEQTNLVRILS